MTNRKKVGMNALSNRLWYKNGKINVDWFSYSFDTYYGNLTTKQVSTFQFDCRSVYLLSVKDKTIISHFYQNERDCDYNGNRLSKNGKN